MQQETLTQLHALETYTLNRIHDLRKVSDLYKLNQREEELKQKIKDLESRILNADSELPVCKCDKLTKLRQIKKMLLTTQRKKTIYSKLIKQYHDLYILVHKALPIVIKHYSDCGYKLSRFCDNIVIYCDEGAVFINEDEVNYATTRMTSPKLKQLLIRDVLLLLNKYEFCVLTYYEDTKAFVKILYYLYNHPHSKKHSRRLAKLKKVVFKSNNFEQLRQKIIELDSYCFVEGVGEKPSFFKKIKLSVCAVLKKFIKGGGSC